MHAYSAHWQLSRRIRGACLRSHASVRMPIPDARRVISANPVLSTHISGSPAPRRVHGRPHGACLIDSRFEAERPAIRSVWLKGVRCSPHRCTSAWMRHPWQTAGWHHAHVYILSSRAGSGRAPRGFVTAATRCRHAHVLYHRPTPRYPGHSQQGRLSVG